MNLINVLVVEDESIVSKDIQQSLKKLGYNIAGVASTGEKAIEIADKSRPDIVLMDIMLKGDMTGIQAAEILKKKWNIPIIYLTAYADESTLNKAKVTEPYGYIIKPFKEIDMHTSIEMALYKHKQEAAILKERDMLYSIVEKSGKDKSIFVKSNSRLVRLEMKEIYFIEALKDYVVINMLDERYTIHSTMKQIENKLPADEFIRVHRSFIVRLDKISSIEQQNILLEEDKKMIPVGGAYKDELNSRIKLV